MTTDQMIKYKLNVQMSDGDVHHPVSSWGHSFSYFLQISDIFLTPPLTFHSLFLTQYCEKAAVVFCSLRDKRNEKLTSEQNSDILDKKASRSLDKIFMHFFCAFCFIRHVKCFCRSLRLHPLQVCQDVDIYKYILYAVCRVS